MSQKCVQCSKRIDDHSPHTPNKPLKYLQWQKIDNKAQKFEVLSTVQGAFDALKNKLKYFLIHTYVKREQSEVFNQVKANVNGSGILIQLDFSENATLPPR